MIDLSTLKTIEVDPVEVEIKELKMTNILLGHKDTYALDYKLPKLTIRDYPPIEANQGDLWVIPGDITIWNVFNGQDWVHIQEKKIYVISLHYQQTADWARSLWLKYKKDWYHVNNIRSLMGVPAMQSIIIKTGVWWDNPDLDQILHSANARSIPEYDARTPNEVLRDLKDGLL